VRNLSSVRYITFRTFVAVGAFAQVWKAPLNLRHIQSSFCLAEFVNSAQTGRIDVWFKLSNYINIFSEISGFFLKKIEKEYKILYMKS
jgi:hypothetical protein